VSADARGKDPGSWASRGYTIVDHAFAEQAGELTLTEICVWTDLRRRAWAAVHQYPTGKVCPRRKTLAAKHHTSEDALDHALDNLVAGGYLLIVRRGKNQTNLYFPLLPDRIKLEGSEGYPLGAWEDPAVWKEHWRRADEGWDSANPGTGVRESRSHDSANPGTGLRESPTE